MGSATDPQMVEQSLENDEIYKAIPAEIQFELNLINARVNWLVASQAFLFVPLTIGAKGGALRQSLFYPSIPILGIVICLLVLIAISAAVWRSQQWRAKCRHGAYAGDEQLGVFSIVMPRTPAIPRMGLIGTVGVPLTLAATWIYLLVAPPVGV